MSSLQNITRWSGLLLRHPREATDRLRIKLQSRTTPILPTNAAPDINGSSGWQSLLLERLGLVAPSNASDDFADLWAKMQAELPTVGGQGSMHDADPVLAQSVWMIVRALKPSAVVETGVARGLTSRFILEAMEENAYGRLWSIDLPPLSEPWASQSGMAVPPRLRDRWVYVRGSSHRMLPRVLQECGQIDLFVHDSLHTYHAMLKELSQARQHLAPAGILIADDIDSNNAFDEIVSGDPHLVGLTVGHAVKGGAVGLARLRDL